MSVFRYAHWIPAVNSNLKSFHSYKESYLIYGQDMPLVDDIVIGNFIFFVKVNYFIASQSDFEQ